MYWPIGAPRVYAASLPQSISSDAEIATSESRPKIGSRNTENEAAQDDEETESAVRDGSAESELDPGQEKIGDTSKEESKLAQKRESVLSTGKPRNESVIVGLEVARHGRFFATITGNALTVWQTQVSSSHISPRLRRLIYESRQRCWQRFYAPPSQ